MSNLVNNSYTRALASGFVVSTIPEFSKKSLPISLTSAVSMAVGRTFDSLSKEIGARRKALDANIAHLAVPTTCIALAAHHLLSPENSSILDVSAVIMGLIAADTKIIQPAIKFLAPTQSSYKALSLLQQVPLIKYYPSLLKISAAYGLSSLAAQLIENSLSASETLPLCEKFAIATFVSFAAVDLYPTFSSTFAGVKNFFTPPPPL